MPYHTRLYHRRRLVARWFRMICDYCGMVVEEWFLDREFVLCPKCANALRARTIGRSEVVKNG